MTEPESVQRYYDDVQSCMTKGCATGEPPVAWAGNVFRFVTIWRPVCTTCATRLQQAHEVVKARETTEKGG